MAERVVTTCDLCNVNGVLVNRGFFNGSFYFAAEHYGWAEEEFGHICSDCIAEREAQLQADQNAQATDGVGLDALLENAKTFIK